jgi:hypothetical protein
VLTPLARVAGLTGAGEAVNQVRTLAAVLTRVTVALVDVCFTCISWKFKVELSIQHNFLNLLFLLSINVVQLSMICSQIKPNRGVKSN